MIANQRPRSRRLDASRVKKQAMCHAVWQIVEMMCNDEQLRAARGNLFQGSGKVCFGFHIKAVKRLIQNEQLRIVDEGAQRQHFS